MAGNFPVIEDNGTRSAIDNAVNTAGNFITASATGSGNLVFDATAAG